MLGLKVWPSINWKYDKRRETSEYSYFESASFYGSVAYVNTIALKRFPNSFMVTGICYS